MNGGGSDGKFFVRKYGNDSYVISVIYKGKPTQHLCKKNPDTGCFHLGKNAIDDANTIRKVVKHLKNTHPYWPVALDSSVKADGASGRPDSVASIISEVSTVAGSDSGTARGGDGNDWLFGPLTKEAANSLVTANQGGEDGSFMVRARNGQEDQFVLCVVFRGKPTHHLMAQTETGAYTINKKSYGEGPHATMEALIMQLQKPGTKGWPVPLTKPCSGGMKSRGVTAAPSTSSSIKRKSSSKKSKRGSKKGSTKSRSSTTTPTPTPTPTAVAVVEDFDWLYGSLSKEESGAYVLSNQEGADGSFLVRERDGHQGFFVLTVVFRSKATHHLIAPVDGTYTINKKKYGAGDQTTMQALIETLSKPGIKGWPVALDKPCLGGRENRGATSGVATPSAEDSIPPPPPPETSKPKEAPPSVPSAPASKLPIPSPDEANPKAPSPPRQTAEVLPSPLPRSPTASPPAILAVTGNPPWLYGKITRESSEKLLSGMANGNFLIRLKDSATGSYYLSCVYKGRVTQHSVDVQSDGKFAINKVVLGDATTLVDLVDHLSRPCTGWPTKGVLTNGIVAHGHVSGAGWPAPVDSNLPPIDILDENSAAKFRISEERRLAQLEADEEFKLTAGMDKNRKWLMRYQKTAAIAWQRRSDAIATVKTTALALAQLTPIEFNPEVPSYLFDDCSKKRSMELLSAKEDGAFLIRRKYGNDNVCYLDIRFKEEVTTHLLEKPTLENQNPIESVTSEHAQKENMAPPVEDEAHDGSAEVDEKLHSAPSTPIKLQHRQSSVDRPLDLASIQGATSIDPMIVQRMVDVFAARDQGTATESSSTLPNGTLTRSEILHCLDKVKVTQLLAESDLIDSHIETFAANQGKGKRAHAVAGLITLMAARCPVEGLSIEQFLDALINGFKSNWSPRESTHQLGLSSTLETGKIPKHPKRKGSIGSRGDPLDEKATFGQLLTNRMQLVGLLKKAGVEISTAPLEEFLATQSQHERGKCTAREFLEGSLPGIDLDCSLSPREQILKAKLQDYFFDATKIKEVVQEDLGREHEEQLTICHEEPIARVAESELEVSSRSRVENQAQVDGTSTNVTAADLDDEIPMTPAKSAEPTPEPRALPNIWLLNGTDFGGFTTLHALILRLKLPLKGWPVVLTSPICNPLRNKRRVANSHSGEYSIEPSYLWKGISIIDAEEKIVGPNGTFLIRKKLHGAGSEDFTMAVKFQNQCTHHKISRDGYGFYLLNDQHMGKQTTLDGLVTYLETPGRWPVALNNPIRPPEQPAPNPPMPPIEDVADAAKKAQQARTDLDTSTEMLRAADLRVQTAGSLTNEQEYAYESNDIREVLIDLDLETAENDLAIQKTELRQQKSEVVRIQTVMEQGGLLPGLSTEDTPDCPSYLWDDLSKADTELKVIGKPEGTFLVRRRKFGSSQQFILTIVYGCRPTHHSVATDSKGVYLINNQPNGNKKSLHDVILYLYAGVKGWPVRLSGPIVNPVRTRGTPTVFVEAKSKYDACMEEVKATERLLSQLKIIREQREDDTVMVDAGRSSPELFVSQHPDKVVQQNITSGVAALLTEIRRDCAPIFGMEIPMAEGPMLSVILSGVASKLDDLIPLQGEGRRIGTIRRATGETMIPSGVSPRSDMQSMRTKIGQVLVALELVDTITCTVSAGQTSVKLASDISSCDHAITAARARAEVAQEQYQRLKLDAIDLDARIAKALATPQGQAGAVPPVLLKRLQQKSTQLARRIEETAEEYALGQNHASEIDVIRGRAHMRQFYLRASEQLSSVLIQMRSIQQARTRGIEGVQCALGFVPIPIYGPDKGASKLFAAGIMETDEQIALVADETAKALTIRFQDQTLRLRFAEVERFARWFSRPILELLVKGAENPAKGIIFPAITDDVPSFFVRAVDRFVDGADQLEEYDDDVVPKLFNQAMQNDLLGGGLVISDDCKTVSPATVVCRAGLRTTPNAAGKSRFYHANQTDVVKYGYRHQLPSSGGIYESTEQEIQVLGWTKVVFLAHEITSAEAGSKVQGSASTTTAVTKEILETTLLGQKTAEANMLSQRVLELEAKLQALENSTSA
jgi:hypothetical protein